jgi:hypothetical protein
MKEARNFTIHFYDICHYNCSNFCYSKSIVKNNSNSVTYYTWQYAYLLASFSHMVDDKRQIVKDIKRILIDRDITPIKQAFYRILCCEIRNNGTRVFIPHKAFSQSRLQSYLSNKELGFGRQVYESEDFMVYNTIVEAIIRELVDDRIVKQQKESTPDDPEDRYEVTQKLDTICKDFRDSGLSF